MRNLIALPSSLKCLCACVCEVMGGEEVQLPPRHAVVVEAAARRRRHHFLVIATYDSARASVTRRFLRGTYLLARIFSRASAQRGTWHPQVLVATAQRYTARPSSSSSSSSWGGGGGVPPYGSYGYVTSPPLPSWSSAAP